MKFYPKLDSKGFTLIEIMVSLLILAGLSVLMAQSVRSGLQSRKKVQREIAEESRLRDVMRVISADIGAAYHHRDITVAMYNDILEQRKKKPAGATASPAPSPAPGAPGEPAGATKTPQTPQLDPLASATPLPIPTELTGFVGDEKSMTLTVNNHVRRYVDSPESDLATINYYLGSCRTGDGNKYHTTCLYRAERTEPTNKFDLGAPDDENAKKQMLLPFITEFKLGYIKVGMDDFTGSWDSRSAGSTSQSGATASGGDFPDAVQIKLTTQNKEDKNSKAQSLTWLAPIRNSNNQDAVDKASDSEVQPGSSTRGGP